MSGLLYCYRSISPEPLEGFDAFLAAYADWRDACGRFAHENNPTPDNPRDPVITEGWGLSVQGLEAHEWRKAEVPAGWRLTVPGVQIDPFDSLGCWPSRIEGRLYLASKRDLAERIDTGMWEPIKQSEYHAAREAEEAAVAS